jgi:hypothetical protein
MSILSVLVILIEMFFIKYEEFGSVRFEKFRCDIIELLRQDAAISQNLHILPQLSRKAVRTSK